MIQPINSSTNWLLLCLTSLLILLSCLPWPGVRLCALPPCNVTKTSLFQPWPLTLCQTLNSCGLGSGQLPHSPRLPDSWQALLASALFKILTMACLPIAGVQPFPRLAKSLQTCSAPHCAIQASTWRYSIPPSRKLGTLDTRSDPRGAVAPHPTLLLPSSTCTIPHGFPRRASIQ